MGAGGMKETALLLMMLGISLAMEPAEREEVEMWINSNGLNRYGDPEDTMYMGGSPLFDERSGETTDRFVYIVSQHPDRPWATGGGTPPPGSGTEL